MSRLKVFARPVLREIRLRKGLTLERFSRMAGYSAAGYCKAELRRNGLRPDKVAQIMAMLEMEFDELFEFVYEEEE